MRRFSVYFFPPSPRNVEIHFAEISSRLPPTWYLSSYYYFACFTVADRESEAVISPDPTTTTFCRRSKQGEVGLEWARTVWWRPPGGCAALDWHGGWQIHHVIT